MTDAQFLEWLQQPFARRCVLVEAVASVAGVETTRYFASEGYVTAPDDDPANQVYDSIISGGISITEQLPLNGAASLAFGDIEVYNVDGSLDSWLDDVWANREISVFVGDLSWPRADFRLVFSGLIEDIGSRGRDYLNFKIRDKLQRLNTPVIDATLGGATANADRLLPVCLGEVHNVEPLLVNPATLQFQVHNGAIEDVVEVRDEGVPVAITKSLATGKFTLNAQPAGRITATVQGDKPSTYANTVGAIVRRLATGYGTDPLDDATEVDDDSFSDFESANPQPVGLYLEDRDNVLACCQRLAASVGAQVVMSATGKLRLLKIELPPPGTPTAVDDSVIEGLTLEIAERIPVRAGVKVAYCENYTVQPNLQTGIPPEHADLFAQQWLTVTASDGTVASAYRISEAPPQQETCLLATSDAQDEADRRVELWKVPRTIYRYRGLPALMLAELGSGQTITQARYGMSGGVTGQIVGLTKDWLACSVTVEVLA